MGFTIVIFFVPLNIMNIPSSGRYHLQLKETYIVATCVSWPCAMGRKPCGWLENVGENDDV